MKTSRPSSYRWGWGIRHSPADSEPRTVKGGEVMKIKKLTILAVVAGVAAFMVLAGGLKVAQAVLLVGLP